MVKLRLILFIVAFFVFSNIFANTDAEKSENAYQQLSKLFESEKFEDAKAFYLQNKSILADGHVYEMMSSWFYATILWKEGDYIQAFEEMEHSIDVLEDDYVTFMSLDGNPCMQLYYYHAYFASCAKSDETEHLYRKAKEIYEEYECQNTEFYFNICEYLCKIDNKNEINQVYSLIESAIKDNNKHIYDSAISKLQKCLTILDRFENPNILLYCKVSKILGMYAQNKGDYALAENVYERALKILEHYENYSSELQYLSIKLLISMGVLYNDIKNYSAAISTLTKAKLKLENIIIYNSDYVTTLTNLAISYYYLNNYIEAKKYVKSALVKLNGIENVDQDALASLYNVASVCHAEMGEIDDALSTALLSEQYLSSKSAPSLHTGIENNISTYYMSKGDYRNALEHIERAVSFENSNPLIRYNYVSMLYYTNDKRVSKETIISSDMLKDNALSNFLFLSDSQRFNYWSNIASYLDAYNLLLYKTSPRKFENNGYIYNNALFSKGILMRISNYLTHQISTSNNKRDTECIESISRIKAYLYDKELPKDSINYYNGIINTLEKELQKNNLSYSTLKKYISPDWKMIRDALTKGEAAIEFIHFPGIRFGEETIEEQSYAAIVLKKDSKYPEIIHLFDDSDFKLLSPIYKGSQNIRKTKATGASLYELIFSKLEPYLSGISKIYYSPIGVLNAIPFSSLVKDNEFLIDKYNLKLVSSTYEIPELKKSESDIISSALVYGGIDFDTNSNDLIIESRKYAYDNKAKLTSVDLAQDDGERSGWQFLPGTLIESENIFSKLQHEGIECRLLSANSANEESFKSLSGNSPSLIHIATHGFFLADKKDVMTNNFIKGINANISSSQFSMNRSGLLFAGANRTWTGQEKIKDIEDGILTADEISNMDLSNTDIVILSACETGLGVNWGSEGVFGLQRAFKLAGVKTLIMSLWKVSDEATSRLMQLFYDNWLGGMEKHEAFAFAQRKLKEEKPNPYFWAAFVMLD